MWVAVQLQARRIDMARPGFHGEHSQRCTVLTNYTDRETAREEFRVAEEGATDPIAPYLSMLQPQGGSFHRIREPLSRKPVTVAAQLESVDPIRSGPAFTRVQCKEQAGGRHHQPASSDRGARAVERDHGRVSRPIRSGGIRSWPIFARPLNAPKVRVRADHAGRGSRLTARTSATLLQRLKRMLVHLLCRSGRATPQRLLHVPPDFRPDAILGYSLLGPARLEKLRSSNGWRYRGPGAIIQAGSSDEII